MVDFPQCFLNQAPNVIEITLPKRKYGSSAKRIVGLLSRDVELELQNNFSSLVPDVSALADISQLTSHVNIASWIGASAQAWKGTGPLVFNVDFYLINWAPNLGYENDLKDLAWMCTLQKSSASGITENFTVQVHGGYQADFFTSNNNQFIKRTKSDMAKASQNLIGTSGDRGQIQSIGTQMFNGNVNGTVSVKIGSRSRVADLLIRSLHVSPSITEVKRDNEDPKPLYYRVNIGFMTCRAALESDVVNLF